MAFSEAGRPTTSADHAASELLFVGAVFCDLVFSVDGLPEPGGEIFADRFVLTAGGTANRAVAAARLGVRSALASRIGSDPLGMAVRDQLRAEKNLDLSWLRTDAAFQTPVTVSLADRDDRSFITYEEASPPPAMTSMPGRVSACHLSASRALPDWVADLRHGGTILVGGVGWDGTGAWSPELLDNIRELDVFCANAVEAMNYTRTDDPVTAARELSRHVGTSIVTLGGHGVVAFEDGGDRQVTLPGVPVQVIDPTGAGDVFVAALMVALHEGLPLTEQLALATIASAISVGTLGGASAAPTASEIAAFITDRRPEGDWTAVLDWARDHTHTLEGQS